MLQLVDLLKATKADTKIYVFKPAKTKKDSKYVQLGTAGNLLGLDEVDGVTVLSLTSSAGRLNLIVARNETADTDA